MCLVHLRCMGLKNLGCCQSFCQIFIEFFNIRLRASELPPTCYSTMVLSDPLTNLETKNKVWTCISECWDKNTGCLVAYRHFCFKLTGIFAKTIQITPVNLHEFCKMRTLVIYIWNTLAFLMVLGVDFTSTYMYSCWQKNWPHGNL